MNPYTYMRPESVREAMTTVFRGYDARPRAADGTWQDMTNLWGGDEPALGTRPLRRTVQAALTAPAGLCARDAMAVVEGSRLIYGGHPVELALSTAAAMCPKQLVSMGAYLVVWPDKKYLNTADLSDFGPLENRFALSAGVTVAVQLCRRDGSSRGTVITAAQPPEDPSGGTLWMDISDPNAPALKEWSGSEGLWVVDTDTYVKLSAPNIGKGFSLDDGVDIGGLTGALEKLNGSHVLSAVGDGYLVIAGILAAAAEQQGGLTVRRDVPDMDYITECGNRLWGCKYGMVEGRAVNEIYASKLGDFKNWRCWAGLSTDSFAASRGSDGVFTGAATHLGHPLFFKEDCIEKVFPSDSGAHRIVTIRGRGVQRGCWRSLAIVGETLYYKSPDGVCAYTGSLPVSVSAPLGEARYSDARAGAAGGVYWISMRRGDGTWHLFTYDAERRLWHRQDSTRAMMFAAVDGELRWIDETTGALMGDGSGGTSDKESSFTWSATSGVMGYDLAEQEYISRFVIRCDTEGTVSLAVRYDGGDWQERGSWQCHGLGSILLPVAPRRCDHLRIRLTGNAPCRIYSIARQIRRGSDVTSAEG